MLAEDIEQRLHQTYEHQTNLFDECQIKLQMVLEIEKVMSRSGRSVTEFNFIPHLDFFSVFAGHHSLLTEKQDYDVDILKVEFQPLLSSLNFEQQKVFNTVHDSVERKEGGFYFVYGSDGTGKTFLWKTIITYWRSKGNIVLAVASSSIASLLLPSRRTAHSKFEIQNSTQFG